MIARLNKYERVAGAFILTAAFGMTLFLFNVLWEEGWLRAKVTYKTYVTTTEGLGVGSPVEMAGLRIGKIDSLTLQSRDKIEVQVRVLKEYQSRVTADSHFQLARKGLFGERVLILSMGDPALPTLPGGSVLPNEEAIGIIEILSGRALTPYLATLSQVFTEFKEIADLFLKNKGSDKYVSAVKDFSSLVQNLTRMSNEMAKIGSQLNEGNQLKVTLRNVAALSEQLNAHLPQLAQAAPNMGQDFGAIVSNLAVLTTELKKVLPAFAEIAPELPRSSRRMIEAIDEAVVTLKAMQRSFFLKGSAREVREEEAAATKKREPAGQD